MSSLSLCLIQTIFVQSAFLTFLRKRGRKAEAMHMIEKIDIGAGSGNSAIIGERTVENLAKMLQIPNAVEQRTTGNI